MEELLASVVHRPYVFLFLASFLVLAPLRFGFRKTILWLVSGYFIAWASELSSISNGFPYGWYSYVYENLSGELMVAGVPFFDSLSYAFLTFAGFTTAEYILKETPYALRPKPYAHIFLGAALTMLLDVIVDPIATMGDKWFLGKIHVYADPGWYFGVPMTNFGGWFLVSFAIIGFNALAWRAFPKLFESRVTSHDSRWAWMYPAFYAGIALFAVSMSFWVGEWKLGLASTCILLIITAVPILIKKRA